MDNDFTFPSVEKGASEEYALQELRKSVNVQTTESNPFLTADETLEEYEEEEEDFRASSSKHGRHPYGRYNSNSSVSSRPPPEPRRHSRINLLTLNFPRNGGGEGAIQVKRRMYQHEELLRAHHLTTPMRPTRRRFAIRRKDLPNRTHVRSQEANSQVTAPCKTPRSRNQHDRTSRRQVRTAVQTV